MLHTIVPGGALHVGAAIAGLIAVLVMAAVVIAIIRNTNRKMRAEYALSKYYK